MDAYEQPARAASGIRPPVDLEKEAGRLRKPVILVAAATVAVLLLTACDSGTSTGQGGAAAKQVTAAWIYVGSASDAGWTHQHDLGRLAVQNQLGSRVKTIFKQNVPEGPQTTSVIQQLVNDGAQIIFATSFGFQSSMVEMARKYPNVKFAQATGTATASNLSEYFGAGEDADYLTGMAAGYATKNGKIGFVAPFPIPEVIREINAYTMGARYAHPGATVRVVWTNSWFDPAKERAAAQSLVSSGVDVLGDGVDDPTVGEVAAASGLKWTGYDSDQNTFAPDAFQTATVYNWAPYYTSQVKAVVDGTWRSDFYYGTVADGMIDIAPFGRTVSAQAQTAINKRKDEIKAGSFDPFTGPLTKQDGSVGLPAGQKMKVWDPDNPSQLSKYTMDWFVQGVIGSAKG